jgi:hypothetical protein
LRIFEYDQNPTIRSMNRSETRLLGPGQSDFGRIYVPSGKDALGSMHWNVDHCPIAMQLKKPAAVDCP